MNWTSIDGYVHQKPPFSSGISHCRAWWPRRVAGIAKLVCNLADCWRWFGSYIDDVRWLSQFPIGMSIRYIGYNPHTWHDNPAMRPGGWKTAVDEQGSESHISAWIWVLVKAVRSSIRQGTIGVHSYGPQQFYSDLLLLLKSLKWDMRIMRLPSGKQT